MTGDERGPYGRMGKMTAGETAYSAVTAIVGFGTFIAIWVALIQVSAPLGIAFGWIPAAIGAFVAVFAWPLAAWGAGLLIAWWLWAALKS